MEFIEQHFDEIHQKTIATLGGGFGGMISAFCDPAIRDEVVAFLKSKNLQGGERSMRLGIERANACINFKQAQSERISQWLKSQPTQ